jgi:putative transposase
MILTYRFKLLPKKNQRAKLENALSHTRDLYNSAMQERVEAYSKKKLSINLYQQYRDITILREDKSWAEYAATLQRWPLKQVDLAFKAFFRRLKAKDQKAGFPRFKGPTGFNTFGFTDRIGWQFRENRLYMKGIGRIRVHIHREIPSAPIALKVKREGKDWFALITVEVPSAEPLSHTGTEVGLDMGVTHFATLSTGEHIANPRHNARMAKKIKKAQRALARCKKGSKNRQKVKEKFAKLKRQETNARTTHLHQVSARLTREHAKIVVEDLNLRNMTLSAKGSLENPGVNVSAKRELNRALADVAFGRFKMFLRYKAEKAGGVVVEVDPRNTSRTCFACGTVNAANRTSQAKFLCVSCGHEENADVNAARNIASRGGVVVPGALNTKNCLVCA